jgi:hypothetical protein
MGVISLRLLGRRLNSHLSFHFSGRAHVDTRNPNLRDLDPPPRIRYNR